MESEAGYKPKLRLQSHVKSTLTNTKHTHSFFWATLKILLSIYAQAKRDGSGIPELHGLHGRQFFCVSFAVFIVLVLVLIDSVLAGSVPVQSQYLKFGPVPVPVPVHQYQK